MKRIMLILNMLYCAVGGVMGQASAIHDESIMQQYMVAENGKGMLTPQYYYQAFIGGITSRIIRSRRSITVI